MRGDVYFFLFFSTTNHRFSEKKKEKNFKTLTLKKKVRKFPNLKWVLCTLENCERISCTISDYLS